MAWATSDRRSRLPSDWPAIRRRILKRDGYRCTALMRDRTRCTEEATDVDHIRPGDDHDDSNLTSLCGWHHARKSSREGGQALAAKRKKIHSKFRRTEDHPGSL